MTKAIRILGIVSALAYVAVMLGVWMYQDTHGHTYFKAGEPNKYIKYPEWVLGIIGALVLLGLLKEELDR